MAEEGADEDDAGITRRGGGRMQAGIIFEGIL
jgi:hypothetical protein